MLFLCDEKNGAKKSVRSVGDLPIQGLGMSKKKKYYFPFILVYKEPETEVSTR